MQRTKEYPRTLFPAEVIWQGYQKYVGLLPELKEGEKRYKTYNYSVGRGAETWSYDSVDEFLANYRGGFDTFKLQEGSGEYFLYISSSWERGTSLGVSAPSSKEISAICDCFDAVAEKYQIPEEQEEAEKEDDPTVFVGHGHSKLWRDLKDHLHEKHGYDVDAYETGARAGHAVRDVLEEMLNESSFAILVMTAEDEMADGKLRARQNVIHEAGLFQGRLGFPRAIVIREDGTEEFSNLAGINELRFSKGNIKEIFGDIVATLRREFPNFNPAVGHARAA